MDDFQVQEKIMRLRVTIRQQKEKITALADEVKKLENQLAPIQARYDRIVAPIADKVLVLQEAVRDLEAMQRRQRRGVDTPLEDFWQDSPWNNRNYADQFNTQSPADEPKIPTKRPEASADIKKVYRQLARRYHPDLAPNPQEETRRNAIMAKINEAYAERDLEGLLTIAGPGAKIDEEPANEELSLNELKLRRLEEESADLCARLEDLKVKKFDLTHNNVLFDLKLQEKWDKRDGRSPLHEMAAWFEKEYERLSRRLYELRRQVGE